MERYLLAIGRKVGVGVPRRILRAVLLVGTICVHLVVLGVAVPIGGEVDLLAAGREDRVDVPCLIVGEASLVRAIGVHHVDLGVGVRAAAHRTHEGNLITVR